MGVIYGIADFDRLCVDMEGYMASEKAIGLVYRADVLDLFGHGTTYTSEDVQRMIKGLPFVNVDQDSLDMAIRSLQAWKNVISDIEQIKECYTAYCDYSHASVCDECIAIIEEKLKEVRE